jgi:hypothetical protein
MLHDMNDTGLLSLSIWCHIQRWRSPFALTVLPIFVSSRSHFPKSGIPIGRLPGLIHLVGAWDIIDK